MIPALTSLHLVVTPIDGRLGADGLSHFVQHMLGASPCDGSAYLFCNKRRSRLKLLCWDGTGVWLAQRRLHRGIFVWPRSGATQVMLTAAQFSWLITGVDWQRLRAELPNNWRV